MVSIKVVIVYVGIVVCRHTDTLAEGVRVCVRLVHSPDAVLGAAVALYRILLERELLKDGVYTSARGTSVRQHERQHEHAVFIKRVRAGRGARGE